MRHTESLSRDEPVCVAYFDAQDRLLCVGPSSEAERFGLWRRVVGAALVNAEHKLYVSRRTVDGVLCWDVSASTCVRAGESRREAVLRALSAVPFEVRIAETPVTVCLPERRVRVTVFGFRVVSCGVGGNSHSATNDGMFLDRDELCGLAEHFPDLLTPALLWLIHNTQYGEPSRKAEHPCRRRVG